MRRYQPIPCAQHERLELAALRRTPLRISYSDDGTQIANVFIDDVRTQDGAEWLDLTEQGTNRKRTLRLDMLLEIQDLPRISA